MQNKKSIQLFEYWNTLRGQKAAPDRSEIEPNDIRELLGDTFILEIDPKYQAASFRLAGTRLCNAYGRELKTLGFLNIWDEQDNFAVLSTVRKVYIENRPQEIRAIAVSTEGETAEFEFLFLPLQNGGSSTARVIGVATCADREDWIGINSIETNVLKSVCDVQISERGLSAPIAPVFEEAPSLAPFRPASAKQVGHLTVIDGGMA